MEPEDLILALEEALSEAHGKIRGLQSEVKTLRALRAAGYLDRSPAELLATRTSEAARLRELLVSLEWAGTPDGSGCPICRGDVYGHDPECELAALLVRNPL